VPAAPSPPENVRQSAAESHSMETRFRVLLDQFYYVLDAKIMKSIASKCASRGPSVGCRCLR